MVSIISNFPKIIISLCLACYVGWVLADYSILWSRRIRSHYVFGQVDLYWSAVVLLPLILGHFITIWCSYFRSISQFEQLVAQTISPPVSSGFQEPVKRRFAIWERHHRSGFNQTSKVWCLAGVIIFLNLYWFILTTVQSRQHTFVKSLGNTPLATVRSIAYGASQALLLNTSIILFLVLRRSMLEAAFGMTYKDTLPLHRWLGAAMVGWGILHGSSTMAWLSMMGHLQSDIAFTDKTRGNRIMCGVFALCGLVTLSLFALPMVRRAIYPVYLYVHRCGVFMFLTGLMMHYPYVMLWYYVLPSFVLFLLDRFVPRIIQAWTIDRTATFTLDTDADIIRVQLNSREPMKPYFPGDFIKIMVPGLGNIYHPFTIASYWPEDPYTMTLFLRVFANSRFSWTNAVAKVCSGKEGLEGKKVANLRINVDGAFGGRRHDYLKADTVIIFIAGAAITTFMALIKAVAAQIAASPTPPRMRMYLICTFRTSSELHAYGSFLHQITCDPRFTSWLSVEIYVSRPDKRQAPPRAQALILNNDIVANDHCSAEANSSTTAAAGSTSLQPPMTEIKLSTLSEKKVLAKSTAYDGRPLPIFESSSVSARSTSAHLVYYDLFLSAILVVLPLCVFYSLRTVAWEGSSHWCLTTMNRNSNQTVAVCDWAYALVPGFSHLLTFLGLGYSAIFFGRRMHRRRVEREGRQSDVENNEIVVEPGLERATGIEDGVWDDEDVPHTRGKLDIGQAIQTFLDSGIGCPSSSFPQQPVNSLEETEQEQEPKQNQPTVDGLVAVLAGGPEGFVNMIESQVYKTAWSVEFYRETWAP